MKNTILIPPPIYNTKHRVAVVIPCFKVKSQILPLLKQIGSEVDRIFVVDDCCPEKSGDYVVRHCTDKRVKVLKNKRNLGVGGAVISGYIEAIEDNCDIVVKLDGDGQMDPSLIARFIRPIEIGRADYTKGNRFYSWSCLSGMPKIRIFGNSILSFLSKFSCGYWSIFDPTNGYTAIHTSLLKILDLNKVSQRYFFETDMLFRLNSIGAVVEDIPMNSKYENETSNLHIRKIIGEFLGKHFRNFIKRIIYNYYLRGLSIGSFLLPVGLFMFFFGVIWGCEHWYLSATNETATPTGTVMIAVLNILIGLQFVLLFLVQDMSMEPKKIIHDLVTIKDDMLFDYKNLKMQYVEIKDFSNDY